MKIQNITAVCVLIFSGCSNYSNVVKENLTGSEKLLIQAPKIKRRETNGRTISVQIDSSMIGAIPENGYVDKEKTFILPLLIWNSWDHISTHHIGSDQIEGSVYEYIQRSFEQALAMRGYNIVDENADIQINIKPKKIESSGVYEKDGFFYFFLIVYGYGYGDRKGPYESVVNFEVETKIGEKRYNNEIVGESILSTDDFEEEETELGKVSRALEFSISNSIVKFITTLPN